MISTFFRTRFSGKPTVCVRFGITEPEVPLILNRTGKHRQIVIAPIKDDAPFDVTADGNKFLVNTGHLKEGSDPLTLVLNWTAELKK